MYEFVSCYKYIRLLKEMQTFRLKLQFRLPFNGNIISVFIYRDKIIIYVTVTIND